MAKSIPKTDLTAEFVRSILDYDPVTGIFRWRFREGYPPKWNNKHAGKPAGCSVRDYIQIRVSTETGCHPAHRLAWLYVHGRWPRDYIDHINGDPSDNRLENLRECSHMQNCFNRKKQSNNASGHIGVFWRADIRKWRATITRNRKVVWRRNFATAQEAAAERRKALAAHHGEFASRDS